MFLGKSRAKMKDFGCNVCSVASLSWYFASKKGKKGFTPDWLASKTDCFTPDGQLIYSVANKYFQEFGFVHYGSENHRDDKRIQDCLKHPNFAAILNCDRGAHFVLAISKNVFGSYICMDPWFANKSDVVKVWKDITGARYYTAV